MTPTCTHDVARGVIVTDLLADRDAVPASGPDLRQDYLTRDVRAAVTLVVRLP